MRRRAPEAGKTRMRTAFFTRAKLVSIDTQSYAALTSQSLRATIGRKTI